MNYLNSRIQSIGKSEIRKIFETAGDNVINLGLGEIQFPTPQKFIDYGKKVLDEGYISYTPNAGLLESRKAVSDYYDGKIPPENICLTSGGEEALFTLASVFIEEGDEVLIANPTFVAYESVIKMNGGIPVSFDLVPNDEFHLNRQSFLSKINPKTKMMILCNPSNPTSLIFSKDEMDFLSETCEKNKILIVADEMYRELYLDTRPETFASYGKNIIIISGLTKSHCMSGWRIGWIASNNVEFMPSIIAAHQYICTCAPFISQKVLISALSKDGMKEVNEIRKILKENRMLAIKTLKEIKSTRIIKSYIAPYLFINFGIDDKTLCMDLASKGVLLIPGSAFGTNGKNWVRLNYALDKKLLTTGLEIISQNIL